MTILAGGRLSFDVDFSADTADTLLIGGNVTAPGTAISVADVSSGASSGNDVLIVDVAGTTASGDFALSGGPLSSGAFTYDLTLLGSAWYLTSAVNLTGSVYESARFILGKLVDFPTFRQRVGQRHQLTTDASNDRIRPGAWISAHVDRFDVTPSRSSSGSSFDGTTGGLQFGYDALAQMSENGQVVLSLTGEYRTLTAQLRTKWAPAALRERVSAWARPRHGMGMMGPTLP